MSPSSAYVLLITIIVLCSAASQTLLDYDSPSGSVRLWRHLRKSYDPSIIPKLNSSEQMVIYMAFSLGSIEDLDEKSETLSCYGWMVATWMDDLLTWNPAEWNDTYRLVVWPSQVWLPELVMTNSVADRHDLGLSTMFRASVTADGFVLWVPGFKWRSSCPVDLTFFPFDKQVCQMEFMNWVYGERSANMTVTDAHVDQNYFVKGGEWSLLSTSVTMISRKIPDFPDTFPAVIVSLTLQRDPSYFTLNVIVPCVIITFMAVLVFFLPSESGEKISLGITVLLSYSVLLLMIADITPRTAKQPLLTTFLVVNMGMTAYAILVTVAILNIFHHSPENPLPGGLRFVINILARLVCATPLPKPSPKNSVQPLLVEEVTDKKPALTKGNTDLNMCRPGLEEAVGQWFKEKDESILVEQNRAEWQNAARIVDRFGFASAFCVVVMTTTSLLLTITVFGE